MLLLMANRFLIGDSLGAKADLEKSLDLSPSFVQSWVKIASVHMELGGLTLASPLIAGGGGGEVASFADIRRRCR